MGSHAVFLSYRRSSSAGTAGRLYDTLVSHFGEDSVFMDVDSIRPGDDFRRVLKETLMRSAAAIVVIGPTWVGERDGDGELRLQDPDDFVRMEVEQALAARVQVIPVLVEGATMPRPEELPPSMRGLTERQAIEVSAQRYRYDSGRLVESLQRSMEGSADRGRPRPVRRWDGGPAWWPLSAIRSLLAVGLAIGVAAALFLVPRLTTPAWADLANLPEPLEGAASASFGGRVWVVGGVSAEEGRELLDGVHIYDPQTDAWTAGPTLPAPIAFASLVATTDRLYLIGGQEAAGAVDTVLTLDVTTDSWTEHRPLPAARLAGAAAWDGSRLVYAGGVGVDHAVADEIFALEGNDWIEIGELQLAREKLAAVSDGFGTIWFMGGRDRASGTPAFGTVDVVQRARVSGDPAIEPVHSAGAAWVEGAGPCVLGGDTGTGVSDAVQCLRGTTVPSLASPRAGHAATNLGSTIYVIGGYDAGQHGSATMQRLTLD